MTNYINNWIDGFVAVRDAVYESRGSIELEPDGPNSVRWPRTTGNDVLLIGGMIHAAILDHGSPGIKARWYEEGKHILDDAIGSLAATYLHNRTFWATYEAASVYLDDIEVQTRSSSMWNAVISHLAKPRNAGPTEYGPFAHFEAKTYDDLFNAQRAFLAEKRGADTLEPPEGFGGGAQSVPRTTNADVLQLATYWTQQLADTKKEMGHDGVAKTWQAAIDDVDKLAKTGKPDDVYSKNNELWASARRVAMQVAVSDEAPSKWSMVVSSVKDSIVALPKTVEHVAETGADLLARAANTVGRVTGEVSKGLFSGMGTPILVGAGLIGAYFLARNRHHEEA